MRIAVISSQIFKVPLQNYGGLEAIAYHCAKGLAKRGHQVVLIAPEGSKCEGVQILPTGPAGQWDERKAYDVYWKHLPEFQAIIDHSWGKHSYLLKAEGRLQAPVLGVLHAPVNTMMQSPPPVPKPCVVCISEDQKNHYQSLFNAEARCCYNGLDTNYYKPMSIKRTDRFLFLARFSRIKGADIAIRACLEAGVGLDLVGDTTITNEPDYLQECLNLAKQKSPSWDEDLRGKQVVIHGGATRGECVRWFSQAHALIHSAFPFREPFGMAPVEATLCGCPVLASDNGALRETMTDGLSGTLVKSPEHLAEVINFWKDREWMQLDRENCRKVAKRFSVEAMAERYEQLCSEAIQGGW
jgi:UDP-glucose:tetrahydrobiopterin glucosyltransferase